MRKLGALTFLLLLVINLPAFSQWDPEGVLDSAYINCGKNAYFGSGTSRVSFQVRYKSDNTNPNKIAAAEAILRFTGSNIASLDTTIVSAYSGTAVEHFSILTVTKEYNPNPTSGPFAMSYGMANFTGGVTGDSVLVNVVMNVNDTGVICIDTTHTFTMDCCVEYITESAVGYIAGWRGCTCCRIELYPPGDVNLDKKVDLADVVSAVNYVFRQRKPASIQAVDVNADCQVTLADVIRLFNYVIKGGEKPLVGCAG